MNLISQNAPSKKLEKTISMDGADASSHDQENEAAKVSDGSDLVSLKNKKRRTRQSEFEQERDKNEMKKLENFLFGSLHSPLQFGEEEKKEMLDLTHRDSVLFYMDRSADHEDAIYQEDLESQDDRKGDNHEQERKLAWVDEEEEKITIDISKVSRLRKLRKEANENLVACADYVSRLRAQHIKLNPGTEWAQLGRNLGDYGSDDESNEDNDGVVATPGYIGMGDDDDILRSNEDVVVKSGSKLLPGLLEYTRLVDANSQEPSNGPINSVQFHRNGQLLLAGGLDRRLRFFQIDGKRNTKIESIFIEDCPIRKACFLPDGSQVIFGGRRNFFYCFDLVKASVDKIGPLIGREEKSLEVFEVATDSSTIAFIGNEGYILLVSTRTKELIGTLKMNGTTRSLAFADDGRQLLSSGGDGHIYHWDLRTRRCFHKAVDEGCMEGTALSTSHDSNVLAAGSSSGIVNVYNRDDFLGGTTKPIKAIENLVTKIDGLKFNHDAQILAVTSSMKKNSLRLVHVPSFTVFSNWPSPKQTLQYPRSLDFSPGGGFMVVGNAAGKVLLYKLHHYQHA
ncbi:U3 small nucleolar RNA-associated protein 18 homolog [Aristolochia californica]|uniref:U3 small nucleolar RNA-associated protein 18 homolog n=1 Tax=Aristolochia californica TaxID=171875 RepID=UPI0035DA828D